MNNKEKKLFEMLKEATSLLSIEKRMDDDHI
ncbi:unknown [Bacteroides sp. CAG:702]|nr:unknown [Bacteroides sp. CAG:702]